MQTVAGTLSGVVLPLPIVPLYGIIKSFLTAAPRVCAQTGNARQCCREKSGQGLLRRRKPDKRWQELPASGDNCGYGTPVQARQMLDQNLHSGKS